LFEKNNTLFQRACARAYLILLNKKIKHKLRATDHIVVSAIRERSGAEVDWRVCLGNNLFGEVQMDDMMTMSPPAAASPAKKAAKKKSAAKKSAAKKPAKKAAAKKKPAAKKAAAKKPAKKAAAKKKPAAKKKVAAKKK
jgi:hypothetical protein